MNEGYHLPLLKHVRYYFKTNFNAAAIAADRNVKAYSKKIIPILSSFPIRIPRKLPFLPRSIQIKKIRTSMNHLFKLPTLNDYHRWRLYERDLDVFFLLIYYNKPHHRHLNQFRTEIMRALAEHRHLKFSMGFVSNKVLPEDVKDLQRSRLNMKEYLKQLAYASRADNREKKVVCQIINSMFLFMIMLQISSKLTPAESAIFATRATCRVVMSCRRSKSEIRSGR